MKMTGLEEFLAGIASFEAGVLVAILGWIIRRLVKQLDATTKTMNSISTSLSLHLAWHDGVDLSNEELKKHKPQI